MDRNKSITSRVSQRKRESDFSPCNVERPSSRQRLKVSTSSAEAPQESPQKVDSADIDIIKAKFGDYKHHGTGNPLALRAPSTPKDHAVTKLADIIKNGVVGQASSDSTPKLKTERGQDGSFWTCRLKLAGSYGWTGLILPKDCKTDNPLPIESVKWFLVEKPADAELLEKTLCESDRAKWDGVRERVITVGRLADLARHID